MQSCVIYTFGERREREKKKKEEREREKKVVGGDGDGGKEGEKSQFALDKARLWLSVDVITVEEQTFEGYVSGQ